MEALLFLRSTCRGEMLALRRVILGFKGLYPLGVGRVFRFLNSSINNGIWTVYFQDVGGGRYPARQIFFKIRRDVTPRAWRTGDTDGDEESMKGEAIR